MSSNRHDFINNTLRLEVIGKIVTDDLEAGKTASSEVLNDYETFLEIQLKNIQQYKLENALK